MRSLHISSPLKTYRIYSYDAANKMVTADLIDAIDDAEALAKTNAAGFGSKCELWEGERLVANLGEQRRQA